MKTLSKKGSVADIIRRSIVTIATMISVGSAGSATAGMTLTRGSMILNIDWWAQLYYQSRSYTSATNSAGLSNFYFRRDRIVLSGQMTNRIGFFVDTEVPMDGQAGFNNRSMYLEDAYATFHMNSAIHFIAGKFKIPFSRENLEDCFAPLTMDRSLVLAYTPFVSSRDTGVAMWGNLHNAMFQYRVMVSNGRQGAEQPSSKPMVTGRVTVSLLDPEYGYGYEGTYLGSMKVLTIGAAYEYQPDVVWYNYNTRTSPKPYQAWTADIFWEQPFSTGTYTLSGAYMHYSTDHAIDSAYPDPTLPQTAQLQGYYIKAGYMLPMTVGFPHARLQFFVRHEKQQYNLVTGYDDQLWNSGGFNYYIRGQSIKISGEYAHITYNNPDPTNPALQNYSQVTIELQYMF